MYVFNGLGQPFDPRKRYLTAYDPRKRYLTGLAWGRKTRPVRLGRMRLRGLGQDSTDQLPTGVSTTPPDIFGPGLPNPLPPSGGTIVFNPPNYPTPVPPTITAQPSWLTALTQAAQTTTGLVQSALATPPPSPAALAPVSATNWLDQQAIAGVLNKYLLFGGGALLLVMMSGGRRRRR